LFQSDGGSNFLTHAQLIVGWMTVTVDEDILRIIRIAFNIFHTFPTFSDLLTGQAVAKVCSPVTYKDEAELPFALG